MEDQAAAVGEVRSNTVAVVFAGNGSSVDSSARSRTILPKEGDVVGLLDLDTSNLEQAIASVHRTLGVAILTIENVGVNLRDQGVVLTGAQNGNTAILRSSHFVKTGSSFKEAVNQCLSIILFVGAEVDLETTRLAGHSSRSRGSLVQNAEDTAIIEFSQALTDLTSDRAPDVILAHDFIEVIDESRGDQQVIQSDGGLGCGRIARTKDGHARSAIASRDTTGVNELGRLTTTQSPAHHQLFCDGVVTESLVDFAGKQLEEEASTLSVSRRSTACFIGGA